VVVAYLGMLFAALSLGSNPHVAPLVAAEPKQLVVTLLDRPPAETKVELASSPAAAETPSVSTAPRTRENVRRTPVPPLEKPIEPPVTAAVEPITSVPTVAATHPEPVAAPQPTAAAGTSTSTNTAPNAHASSGGTGTGTGPASGTGTGTGSHAGSDVTILPFTDGMTRPKLLDMVAPQYTREARDANVKGLFLAKCVITTTGALQKCRVIKGLPMMDQAVLSALARWRYTPVIYQGKPVAVDYVIQVRLAGPE
jgi:protein TonB